MIVTTVNTRAFAVQDSCDVELPPTGVVVITGKNGHGKSTLVEAVAQGVWNQPLRGEVGWRLEGRSGVEVHFEGGHVRRSVTPSKHTLVWSVGEEGAADFATRTKSQSAFETHVGSFHVWKHACTFHTKDAARFSSATDAERKRLLERVLELDRVERAYDRVKKKRIAQERLLASAVRDVEVAQARLAGIEGQLDLLKGEVEPECDVEALRAKSRLLRENLAQQKTEENLASDIRDQATAALATAASELRAAQQRAKQFRGLGAECPKCAQKIPHEHIMGLAAEANDAEAETQQRHEELSQDLKLANAEYASARRAVSEAQRAFDDCVAEGRDAVAIQKRNSERGTKRDAIKEGLEQARTELADLEAKMHAEDRNLRELAAAASVLSYKGVRASLLDGAVKALCDFTNDWLARLGLSGLSVVLSSQSTTKGGTVSDKISFEVVGAGGGRGYLAASTGEQRRIDIALLFAIGELAADSRGVSNKSTLFVDEVFDGLDTEGVEAVVAMLAELSTTRCVVVITHNAALASALPAAVRLVAQGGVLKEA